MKSRSENNAEDSAPEITWSGGADAAFDEDAAADEYLRDISRKTAGARNHKIAPSRERITVECEERLSPEVWCEVRKALGNYWSATEGLAVSVNERTPAWGDREWETVKNIVVEVASAKHPADRTKTRVYELVAAKLNCSWRTVKERLSRPYARYADENGKKDSVPLGMLCPEVLSAKDREREERLWEIQSAKNLLMFGDLPD